MNIFLKILKWIQNEILRVIPAVIYFAMAFNLIYFTIGIGLPAGAVRHFTPLMLTIGALIVGKLMLIVSAFPFINAFPNKPLIYNILWKFSIYSVFIFGFGLLDTYIRFMEKYHNFQIAAQHFHEELLSPLLWSTELWLLSVFFIYVVFSEFQRVLGRETITRILFGPK